MVRSCVGGELGKQELAVSADGGERVVDVVRDAAGESADRLELLRLVQLLLEAVSFGLSLFSVGDVEEESLHDLLAVLANDPVGLVLNPDDASVTGDETVFVSQRHAALANPRCGGSRALAIVRVHDTGQ